jgi:Skp family chaperone for outer membrane proteins
LGRAFQETEEGNKTRASLGKVRAQKQRELDEQQKEIKKAIENLNKERASLPPDTIHQREAGLQERMAKLYETYMRYGEGLSLEEEGTRQLVSWRLKRIAAKIAAAKDLAMVLEKNNVVLYERANLDYRDLTDEVIRRCNAGEGEPEVLVSSIRPKEGQHPAIATLRPAGRGESNLHTSIVDIGADEHGGLGAVCVVGSTFVGDIVVETELPGDRFWISKRMSGAELLGTGSILRFAGTVQFEGVAFQGKGSQGNRLTMLLTPDGLAYLGGEGRIAGAWFSLNDDLPWGTTILGKTGHVDMRRALGETEDRREAADLERQYQHEEQELKRELEEIEKAAKDLDRKDPFLPADGVRQKEADLQERKDKVREKYDRHRRHRQELDLKAQEKTASMSARLKRIIAKIAAMKDLAMVVDDDEVYVKPTGDYLDLTAEVIRRCNAGEEVPPSQEPTTKAP